MSCHQALRAILDGNEDMLRRAGIPVEVLQQARAALMDNVQAHYVGPMTDDERDDRRDVAVRRMCRIMGWQYERDLVWAALRKVAMAEAIAVSLDKLVEIMDRLEQQ